MSKFFATGRELLRGNRFVEATLTYGVGQVALKGLDLAAFAMLVRALTPSQLGFVGAIVLLGYIVSDVLSLGVFRVGVPRLCIDPEEERSEILGAAVGCFLIYAVVVGGLVLTIPELIDRLMGLGGYRQALQLYAAGFIARGFAYMYLELLRMDHRVRLQSALEALPSLLNLAVLVALLPGAEKPVEVSAWASLLSWIPLFALCLGHALRVGRPNLRAAGRILEYSAPLTVHRTMSQINDLAGRWVVVATLGLGPAGAFTFFTRVGDLAKLANAPLVKAWQPALLKAAARGAPADAAKASIVFLTVSTAILVGTLAVVHPLARLIDDDGKFAYTYGSIAPVAFAAWILTFSNVFGTGFLVARKPAAIIPITSATAAANVLLSYLISTHYGVLFVPYASVISNLLFASLSIAISRRHFRFDDRRVRWVAFGCASVGVLSFLTDRIFLAPLGF